MFVEFRISIQIMILGTGVGSEKNIGGILGHPCTDRVKPDREHTVAYFVEEVNPSLSQPPLNLSAGWHKLGLTHVSLDKWQPFRRQYFNVHFHEWKVLYFELSFTEVSS